MSMYPCGLKVAAKAVREGLRERNAGKFAFAARLVADAAISPWIES
ncbi:MAG: hypothetical protein SNJ74_10650 [Fimbriimonadaceae bacterium]